MRRLFSLLPLLLPLPNLVQAADPVCTLENRVCAENNNSGKCIRYENTFTCVTLNPAGSRCTVDANPTLTDCTLSAPVCSAESGGICLETTTDFVCKSEPSGEGIRIDDTSVTVSYSKETKGEIPAGCIIGAEVCLDDDARDIEVENWEGHFVSANPVCWVTERTCFIKRPVQGFKPLEFEESSPAGKAGATLSVRRRDERIMPGSKSLSELLLHAMLEKVQKRILAVFIDVEVVLFGHRPPCSFAVIRRAPERNRFKFGILP